jgi:lysophospholipase L1-like esterase
MESRLSRRNPDPKNEAAWPGKGPIRAFDFMVGERKAFWAQRRNDQGAVVFVGDSLTGGWKNLAKDFPKLKVANRGLGGDTSRGALFRFREDALALNPKAVVIEIGNNDLTAMGSPADMLSNLADMVAMAEKERPGTPLVLCTIPSSASPKAPVKPDARQAINEGIRKIASEHKSAHFCDLYTRPTPTARRNPNTMPTTNCTCPTPATPNGRSFSCRYSRR